MTIFRIILWHLPHSTWLTAKNINSNILSSKAVCLAEWNLRYYRPRQLVSPENNNNIFHPTGNISGQTDIIEHQNVRNQYFDINLHHTCHIYIWIQGAGAFLRTYQIPSNKRFWGPEWWSWYHPGMPVKTNLNFSAHWYDESYVFSLGVIPWAFPGPNSLWRPPIFP